MIDQTSARHMDDSHRKGSCPRYPGVLAIQLRTTARLDEPGPHYVCPLCRWQYAYMTPEASEPETFQDIHRKTLLALGELEEIRREATSALNLLAAQRHQKELDDVWLASLPRWRRILVQITRRLR